MGLGVATNATGDNIAIGFQAGFNMTSETDQVAVGESALYSGGGFGNVAIGRRALYTSTAAGNTAVGKSAGDTASTGSNNSFFGFDCGSDVTTGTQNVLLGYRAGASGTNNLTTGSNNILVGYQAVATSSTVSNEITLGNSSITTLRCQVTTITSLSDARDKTDIQPLNAGLEFVEALNPVSFTWNMRDGGKVGEVDTGFIAQDLQTAQTDTGVTIPGLVFDANPDKLEAGYGKLIPVLVQAIKDLSEKVKDLEAKLEAKS
jgi:hypothetical protein